MGARTIWSDFSSYLMLSLTSASCILQILDGGPVLEAGQAAALELVVALQLPPAVLPPLAVVHLPVALGDLLARLDVPVGHADHPLAEVAPHEGGVAGVVEEGGGEEDAGTQRLDLSSIDPSLGFWCL